MILFGLSGSKISLPSDALLNDLVSNDVGRRLATSMWRGQDRFPKGISRTWLRGKKLVLYDSLWN